MNAPEQNEHRLKKIEKEIIETRALIIKSNNLTNSLAAEMRTIAKRQSTYERNLSASSFVVYIIIAVLAFSGAHIAYNARHAVLEQELKEAQTKTKEATDKLNALKKERGEDTASASDKEIEELYAKISSGDRQGTLDDVAKLNLKDRSFLERKLLQDVVRSFRGDLSIQHYMKAMDLLNAKKYAEAVEEFKVSLDYADDAGHSKAARIHMANALRLQGKPREAIAILQKVTEEHLDRELADDTLWWLAQSYQDAHQKDEALSVLKALMRRYPESQFFREARIRAAELKLRMWRDDRE